MRQLRSALALALCALLAVASRAAEPDTDAEPVPVLGEVFDLTDLNFDRVVNGTAPWMIDVFAPWYALIHVHSSHTPTISPLLPSTRQVPRLP